MKLMEATALPEVPPEVLRLMKNGGEMPIIFNENLLYSVFL